MTNTVIWTIAIITVLGLLLALVLYLVAKKFKVEEDPRIDEVSSTWWRRSSRWRRIPASTRSRK